MPKLVILSLLVTLFTFPVSAKSHSSHRVRHSGRGGHYVGGHGSSHKGGHYRPAAAA